MKKTLIITFLLFVTSLVNAQNIPTITTYYSRSNGDEYREEKFIFRLVGNFIEITDLDFNTTEKYGPLRMIKNEYKSDGTYIIQFFSDYTKNNGTDINNEKLQYFLAKGIRVYEFLFDKKGGEILAVGEVISRNNNKKQKNYLTKEGYAFKEKR